MPAGPLTHRRDPRNNPAGATEGLKRCDRKAALGKNRGRTRTPNAQIAHVVFSMHLDAANLGPTHGVWAACFLLIMTRGPGPISLDHLIAERFKSSPCGQTRGLGPT
jgi:hypothetical protein